MEFMGVEYWDRDMRYVIEVFEAKAERLGGDQTTS
jgi:hypothetical protein